MSTIRVTLADVPTDVLVALVDTECDALTIAGIAAALGREGDVEARKKIASAVRLLADGGWAELVSIDDMVMICATDEGRAAIAKARAAVPGEGR